MELVLTFGETKLTLVICDHHHDLIKQEIENYNLSHLIVDNEDDIFGIIERALEGTFATKEDFDPLLMMDFLMWQKAIAFKDNTGIDLTKKDGIPTCLMCEYENLKESTYPWIQEAISRTVETAKTMGFFSLQ